MPLSLEEIRERDALIARVEALEYHTGLKERPVPAAIAPAAADAPADNSEVKALLAQLLAKLG